MYNLNMNLFHVFCLIYLGVSCVSCAPTENKSLYDALLEKCPAVASNPNFKEQDLVKKCGSWEEINQIQNLTDDNKKDVLCLLFFTTFTEYCSHAGSLNNTVPNYVKLDVNAICDKLEIIPKDAKNLAKIIKDESDCKKLCTIDLGMVHPICSVSYYYSHKDADVVPGKPASHFIHVPDSQIVQKESHDTNVQPAKQTQVAKSDTNSATAVRKNPAKTENENKPPEQTQIKPVATIDAKNQPITTQSEEAPKTDASKLDANLVDTKAQGHDNANANIEHKDEVAPQDKVVEPPLIPQVNPPKEDSEQKNDQVPADDDKNKIEDNIDIGNEPDLPSNDDTIQQNLDSEEEVAEPQNILPNEKLSKPNKIDETEAVNYATEMSGDSYFFTYFMLLCIIFIVGYVCYHNKQKILALILEGRRGKRQFRGRRPNSANYHKLDSNLEEAITSSCNKNTNNVIY